MKGNSPNEWAAHWMKLKRTDHIKMAMQITIITRTTETMATTYLSGESSGRDNITEYHMG